MWGGGGKWGVFGQEVPATDGRCCFHTTVIVTMSVAVWTPRDHPLAGCVHTLCSQVFALIRYPDDPQRFSIEYTNGVLRRYAATDR